MTMPLGRLVTALTLACAAFSGAVHATPIASDLRLATFLTSNSVTDNQSLLLSQGTTIDPLSGSVTSLTPSGATASSTGSATWAGAGDLTVSFDNAWSGAGSGSINFGGENPGSTLFQYDFVTDSAGTLQIDWNTVVSGSNTFGVQNFVIRVTTLVGNSTLLGVGVGSGTGAGSLSAGLLDATGYRLSIFDQSNISGGNLGGFNMRHEGTFRIQAPIATAAAVDEPATLLLLAGAVMIGVRLRRA